MKRILTTLSVLLLTPLNSLCAGELKPAAMFSDHMLLQRDRPVPVWGWSDAGVEVTVGFAGQTRTSVADTSGRWMVKLDAMQANPEPQTMTVAGSNGGRAMIQDVLVGDVWLCSGQSNMALTVDGRSAWLYIGGIANAKKEVHNSANPLLRQFYVDWKTDTKPQEHCRGQWTVAGPETTANFTATGYFFARELQRRLQIPIGIINASFGGSSVEGWTSQEALAQEADAEFVAKMNRLLDDYDNHDQLVADYVAALAAWETKYDRADAGGATNDNVWSAPATNVVDWKTVTLPASFAKLGYANGGVARLRREIDVPADFGTAWRFDFPACRAFYAVYLNGVKIITFKHAADGLVARPLPATYHPNLRKPELSPKPLELPSPGSELQGFTICDTTYHWLNAQAKIEGATVVVWSDDVKHPVAVRYAWADHPVCNLYNRAGLPAFPFRTDRLPGLSERNQ